MAALIYKNEYIEISSDSGLFYIQSACQGLSLEAFGGILRKFFPNVRIISPDSVSEVLENAPCGPKLFGKELDRVAVRVSDDAMKAVMTLYVSDDDLALTNRGNLLKEIAGALGRAGVVYGVNTNLLTGPLQYGTEYLIAEGLSAVDGKDSETRLYEVFAPQPRVIDSGNVNHYELNLINRVKEGDWLGERKDPVPGVPGRDVKGREIPPVPGHNLPLAYDRTSVREIYQNGVTTLLANKTGAVYYRKDTIGVYDFLEIKGDIDFSTGNIDFNGFLSVKGTVKDNFTAAADGDIEILSDYGVGAADKIISREGNVYIKGGISGKGKTVIRCKKNLYVKYLSDITVECEGSVYAGFYCMNSNIRAKQVIVESPKGRITGGRIDADICVSAAEIGNRAEMRTTVRVRGFDRNSLRIELEEIKDALKEKRTDLQRTKQRMQEFSSSGRLTPEQNNHFENVKTYYEELKDSIKELEYHYKSINDFLKVPGEGAVIAKKRLYPRVRIEIKDLKEEITSETAMVTYVIKDNELTAI